MSKLTTSPMTPEVDVTDWYGELRTLVEDEVQGTSCPGRIVFCLCMLPPGHRDAALRMISTRLAAYKFALSSISRKDWYAWWTQACDALVALLTTHATSEQRDVLQELCAEIVAACAWANHQNDGWVGASVWGNTVSVHARVWLLDLEVFFDVRHPEMLGSSVWCSFWIWPCEVSRGQVRAHMGRSVDASEASWAGLPTQWSYRKAWDDRPLEQLPLW